MDNIMFKPTHISTSAPTVNDDYADGFRPGIFWWDSDDDDWYICEDDTVGAAVWSSISSGVILNWDTWSASLSWVGGTPAIAVGIYRYAVIGNMCIITIEIGGSNLTAGNITDLTISLPADSGYSLVCDTPVNFYSIVGGATSKGEMAFVDSSAGLPGRISHRSFPTIAPSDAFSLYYRAFYEIG